MGKTIWPRRTFGSFTERILILSVLIGVVPLLGMGLIYDGFTEKMLAGIIEDRVQRRLAEVTERVQRFVGERFRELEMLSDYPPLKFQLTTGRAAPEQDLVQAVIEYQSDRDYLYGILLVGKEGEVISSYASTLDRRRIDWIGQSAALPFGKVHAQRARGLLGPNSLPGAERPFLFLYNRVYRDWERRWTIGLVVLHVELDTVLSLIPADSDGALVPYLRTPEGDYFGDGRMDGALPEKVMATMDLADGWSVVIAGDESRLMAPLIQLRRTLLAVLLGVLALVLAVIWLFYRQSARRIRKLTEGAEAIAHGDLRWRLEDHGRDELARLSVAFNRMAERLQQLIDSTVQTEKMASLGKLATTIAHEVRNPLASIKTGVQAVAENIQDPEQSRILGNVAAEIDRLNRVASELLDFARPLPTRSEETSVREIVERVQSLVERQAHKTNVRIAVAMKEDLKIRVDANHMQQVLMNLVLNSLNAMPDGGELRLEARREGHRVLIEVKDTGKGIEPGLVERVTAPFASSRPEGTGIGLSVSSQLVERNQGRMSIHSVPDQGTTVSLSFPAV